MTRTPPVTRRRGDSPVAPVAPVAPVDDVQAVDAVQAVDSVRAVGSVRAMDGAQAVDGRATAITVMTPIRPGMTPLVRLVLFGGKNLPPLTRPLVKLAFIHYARWSIVTGLPHQGPPQEKESLHYDYLFFETNFNGTWDEYIDAFSEVVPEGMKAIWGTSFGFPGPQPVGPFKTYIHANDLVVDHYYGAYPEATTKTILAALRLREKLDAFRAKAANITVPDDFKQAYDAFLADVQHDL